MNTFTKIKFLRQNIDSAPQIIRDFISEHAELFEPSLDVTNGLIYDAEKKMLAYRSNELGLMSFNFEEEWQYHQSQKYAITREPLAKSLGLTGLKDRIVWDATCGTGKDALLIAHFGAKVIAFERHPLVYLLLVDAKLRFPVPLEIIFGDSSALNLEHLERPDSIFYDPMYPEKKKSALPRLAMQIFKTVVGPDVDSEMFLLWAKKTARDRVVIKRSLHAPAVDPKTDATYKGKSTRYDMYKIF